MESEPTPAEPHVERNWDDRYRRGDVPWDTCRPSRELATVLESGAIQPCRAIELGCGTGTNAVYLAQRGFTVTAVDVSTVAIEQARRRAAGEDAAVDFLVDDICDLQAPLEPFDFVFDRGCYHSVRRINLAGFLDTLRWISRPGAKYLLLAGNANEQTEFGPPRVHEHEIRSELSGLFDVEWIRAFRFEDIGGVEGPLGWSCLLTRRPLDSGAIGP